MVGRCTVFLSLVNLIQEEKATRITKFLAHYD